MTEEVIFQPYDWTFKDAKDVINEVNEVDDENDQILKHSEIRAYALTKESKSVCIRIIDYPNTLWLRLPIFIGNTPKIWSKWDCEILYKWFDGIFGTDAPISYEPASKFMLYYYCGEIKYPNIKCCFRTKANLQRFSRFIKKQTQHYIRDIGSVAFQIWEDDIDPILKLLTERKCKFAGWSKITGKLATERDKVTSYKLEYITSYKLLDPDLDPDGSERRVSPSYGAWDIETYSKNYRAMPNEWSATDIVYNLSIIYGRIGLPDRRRYSILVGECNPVESINEGDSRDATIIKVADELELIVEFGKLITELDPDLLMGHNIFGYDYDFLDARLERWGIKWPQMSRILEHHPEVFKHSWSSAAYGFNSISIVNLEGRLSIDTLPLIKRDFKYDNYDLNTVATNLLGRGKHKITAAEMFRIFDAQRAAVSKAKVNPEFVNTEEYRHAIYEQTRVVKYCLEDSELVIDIFEGLALWFGLIEMANVVNVKILDLFTRGQQIRCSSLIYQETSQNNIIINKRDNVFMDFAGGHVGDPKADIYENIPCLDFKSLYPSIIIERNICYTTLVPKELYSDVPVAQCNIFDFDQSIDPESTETIEETDDTGTWNDPGKDIRQVRNTAGEAGETSEADKMDTEEEDEEDTKPKKQSNITHQHHRFVKKEVRKGLIPRIVEKLVSQRRKVRDRLEGVVDKNKNVIVPKERDPVKITMLDKRQLALKTTANSFFGFMGVKKGRLPLVEGAMCITYYGRTLINLVNDYLVKKYNAKIIYNDTDSVMVDLGIKNSKDCHEWGVRLSKEISALFPPPLEMDFEKAMRIIIFKKKKYAAFLIDKSGDFKKTKNSDKCEILKRGIVVARRDNSHWVREVYSQCLYKVLSKDPVEETFYVITDAIKKLITEQVDYGKLVLVRQLGASYKNPNYFVNAFAVRLRQMGHQINPGDRLEYLIAIIDGKTKVGDKMILPQMYLDDGYKLDYIYYLEHGLKNCIDQLFSVGYNNFFNRAIEVLRAIELAKDPGYNAIPVLPGYKKSSRHKIRSFDHPVEMLASAISNNEPIEKLEVWFNEAVSNLKLGIKKLEAPPKIIFG